MTANSVPLERPEQGLADYNDALAAIARFDDYRSAFSQAHINLTGLSIAPVQTDVGITIGYVLCAHGNTMGRALEQDEIRRAYPIVLNALAADLKKIPLPFEGFVNGSITFVDAAFVRHSPSRLRQLFAATA